MMKGRVFKEALTLFCCAGLIVAQEPSGLASEAGDALAAGIGEEASYVVTLEEDGCLPASAMRWGLDEISDGVYAGELTEGEASRISRFSDVAAVEEDVVFTACADGSGSDSDGDWSSWALEAMGAPEGRSAEGVTVAVVDSGVDASDSYDVVERVDLVGDAGDNPLFDDPTRHGTQMAGAIASDGAGDQPSGVAPGASVVSVRVLDSDNSAPLSRVAAGIRAAADAGADVVSLSLSCPTDSTALESAVSYALDAGCAVVAASGNSGDGATLYPAGCGGVLSAGASAPDGTLSPISSTGRVDVLAPGESVPVADAFGGWTVAEGTSVSCAQVAGAAAVLIAGNPGASPSQVSMALTSTARGVGGSDAGQVDLGAALEAADGALSTWEAAPTRGSGAAPDLSDEVDGIAVGAWRNSGDGSTHETISKKAVPESMGSKAAAVMNFSCANVDRVYGNSGTVRDASGFHAASNYVAGLQYLYNVAKAVDKAAGSSESALRASAEALAKAQLPVTQSAMDPDVYSTLRTTVVEAIQRAHVKSYDGKNLYPSTYAAVTNHRLQAMILGISLHLAGDVFAHRAIVPVSAVSGASSSSVTGTWNADKFGRSDFSNSSAFDPADSSTLANGRGLLRKRGTLSGKYRSWQALQTFVKEQRVEFWDIGRFMTSPSSSKYEDNSSFWKGRVSASVHSCKKVVNGVLAGSTFNLSVVFPHALSEPATSDFNVHVRSVRLNNLQGYSNKTLTSGQIPSIPSSTWSLHTTSEWV